MGQIHQQEEAMKCKRDDCDLHLGLVSYNGYCSDNCQKIAWNDWLSLPDRYRQAEAEQLELFPDYQDEKEKQIFRRIFRFLNR